MYQTNVIVDSAAINIENPFWADGRQYRPQRHVGLKTSEARYQLWRYGFGPRQCLGQHVADRMLRAIMVELVQRYDLSVVDDPTSTNNASLQEESWVGLPCVQIKCRLRMTHHERRFAD
jgi:cytochrome P450